MTTIRQSNPLFAIVTGMEHSGTTFVANLIAKNFPNVECGFECGVLLSEQSPRSFPSISPFYDWLCHPTTTGHWGLTPASRSWTCDTDDWKEFYRRLIASSPRFDANRQRLIDKTPRYCYDLVNILQKIPDALLIIVTKDEPFLLASYKKRGVNSLIFKKRYLKYRTSIKAFRTSTFKNKAIFIDLETASKYPATVLNYVAEHSGELPVPILSYDFDWDTLPPLNRGFEYDADRENSILVLDSKDYALLDAIRRES